MIPIQALLSRLRFDPEFARRCTAAAKGSEAPAGATPRAAAAPAAPVCVRTALSVEDNDPKPVAPERPLDEMCCERGCVPCVFDYYEEALTRYEAALAAWTKRHPGG